MGDTNVNEKLFGNPGGKIKAFAKVMFWVVAAASVIVAFTFVDMPAVLFSILLGAPLAAYINSLLLCGFGELIENVKGIAAQKKDDTSQNQETTSAE